MNEMRAISAPGGLPQPLIQAWMRWAGVTIVSTAIFYIGIRAIPNAEMGPSYLILSYAGLVYQLAFLRGALSFNHRHNTAEILPYFGPGNLASMFRGFLLVLLTGFLFSPPSSGWLAWLPAILYTSGDIIDYVDGILARRSNTVTVLGERMDMEWDAMGLLVATSLAIGYGTLPWIFLPIGMARYAFMLGIWMRRRTGKQVFDLPPSRSRRPIAGFMMGFMSAMLWPIVPYPASAIAGVIFFLPFLLGFGRDWLVVSGVLDPDSTSYQIWRKRLSTVILDWLPLLVRFVLVLGLWFRLREKLEHYDRITTLFSNRGFPSAAIVVAIFGVIELLGLVGITLGFAPRFTAFLLIFPTGFTILATGQDLLGTILLITTLSVLILGSGKLSIWKPAEKLFGSRAGST